MLSRLCLFLHTQPTTLRLDRTLAVISLFTPDSLYYGKPTLTPLNFLLTNLSSISLFYGSNPWHFYVTQALPILCTTALPFVLHGVSSVQSQGNGAANDVESDHLVDLHTLSART